jgi:hypothetical protein
MRETHVILRFIKAGILVAALGLPLLVACIDDHEAEECQYLGTCPPADAGDASTNDGP